MFQLFEKYLRLGSLFRAVTRFKPAPLTKKTPSKVFIKDFDYNRFTYTLLDKFFSLGGCLPNKPLGHFFSVTFLRKASLI